MPYKIVSNVVLPISSSIKLSYLSESFNFEQIKCIFIVEIEATVVNLV